MLVVPHIAIRCCLWCLYTVFSCVHSFPLKIIPHTTPVELTKKVVNLWWNVVGDSEGIIAIPQSPLPSNSRNQGCSWLCLLMCLLLDYRNTTPKNIVYGIVDAFIPFPISSKYTCLTLPQLCQNSAMSRCDLF